MDIMLAGLHTRDYDSFGEWKDRLFMAGAGRHRIQPEKERLRCAMGERCSL